MTFDLRTLDDLNRLGETFELEIKWAPDARQTPETSEEGSEETSEETSQRILGLLRQSPAWSARQLGSQLGLSQRAVELHLAKRKAGNKLKRVGPPQRWALGGAVMTEDQLEQETLGWPSLMCLKNPLFYTYPARPV